MTSPAQEFQAWLGQILDVPPAEQLTSIETIRSILNKLDMHQQRPTALYKIADTVMRLKEVEPNIHGFLETCVREIINQVIISGFKTGSEAFLCIFQPMSNYYTHSCLDPNLRQPLGFNRPVSTYRPQMGELCDIVRPYVTSIGYAGWTRGTVLEVNETGYKVRYANTNMDMGSSETLFAPLGERTGDFDWRMTLKPGDLVDAFIKVWYPSTIIEVLEENGCTKALVGFRRYNENGAKTDPILNVKYDGLSNNEDEWIDITSSRIQMPGKMAKKLCYAASLNEDTIGFNDTYDIIFLKEFQEKPFDVILRPIVNRSLSFLMFAEHFFQYGLQAFVQALSDPELPINNFFNILQAMASLMLLFPRMRVPQVMPVLVEHVSLYCRNQVKNMNSNRMDVLVVFLIMTLGRLGTITEMNEYIRTTKFFYIVEFLKQNMEKQMLALKLLSDFAKTNKGSINDQVSSFNAFLRQQDIFDQLIQTSTHQSILTRSQQLIRYMVKNQIIAWPEIERIWMLFPQSDERGRAMVEKIMTSISTDLKAPYRQSLIEALLKLKPTQLSHGSLNLLSTMTVQEISEGLKLKVLLSLWDCITAHSAGIKSTIEKEILRIFMLTAQAETDFNNKLMILDEMIKRLFEGKNVILQLEMVKEFIQSYPKTDSKTAAQQRLVYESVTDPGVPITFTCVLCYLKAKNVYERLIQMMGTCNKEQIQKILSFINFVFTALDDNVNVLTEKLFRVTGLSYTFLDWCSSQKSFDHLFLANLLQTYSNKEVLVKMGPQCSNPLKALLLLVNSTLAKFKCVPRQRQIMIGPLQSDQEPTNQEICYFVSSNPFEIHGFKLMLELAMACENKTLQVDCMSFIIDWFLYPVDPVEEAIDEYRGRFVSEIIAMLTDCLKQPQMNPALVDRIGRLIKLMKIFMINSEKRFGSPPSHIECYPETMLTYNVASTPTKIQISPNATINRLKTKIAQAINKKTEQFKIINEGLAYDARLINSPLKQAVDPIKITNERLLPVPKVDLIITDKNGLNPKFSTILDKFFMKHSVNGLMGANEFAKMAKQQTNGYFVQAGTFSSSKLVSFDQSGKGGLSLDEMKAYFLDMARTNLTFLWRILNLAGYNNRLKHSSQPQQVSVATPCEAKRLLSQSQLYQLIYTIFANPSLSEVHSDLYCFLGELQTDIQLLTAVSVDPLNVLKLCTSVLQLSYMLEVIVISLHKSQQFAKMFLDSGCVQLILAFMHKAVIENNVDFNKPVPEREYLLPNIFGVINYYLSACYCDNQCLRFVMNEKFRVTKIDTIAKIISELPKPTQLEQQSKQCFSKFKLAEPFALECVQKVFQKLSTVEKTYELPSRTIEVTRSFVGLNLQRPIFQLSPLIMKLNSSSGEIHRAYYQIILLRLLSHPEEVKSILTELFYHIPTTSTYQTSNFFALFQNCLKLYLEMPGNAQDETSIKIAESLMGSLLGYPNYEGRDSWAEDYCLQGFINSLLIVLQKCQSACQQLTKHKRVLMQRLLFFYNAASHYKDITVTAELLAERKQYNHFPDRVKCKRETTRALAMKLITKLHSASRNDNFFQDYLLSIIKELTINSDKKIESRFSSVGLINLGSTCYANSMLQILNSVKVFRNALMQVQCKHPLVNGLKAMFSYLFFSQRVAYSPKALLNSFIPPIVTGIQQDTTEFLNLFFDQLESALKGTPYFRLLEALFRGNQVAQMICHSCAQKRERVEQFFTYSIEIESKTTLQSALEGMSAGEVISDCLCQSCGKRSDTTKRTVLNEIPNIFFIHLKRIVFNYDMFVNTKIYSRLEFPWSLDLEPYTKEGIELRESMGVGYMKDLATNTEEKAAFDKRAEHGHPSGFYKMKLKGIIVHSGFPEGGHYYSIIQTGPSSYKFDDSRVTLFPMSSLEADCYGGTFIESLWGNMKSSTNAYVLVYEKENMQDLVVGEQIIPSADFKTFNTTEWYKEIELDNHQRMLEQHLLEGKYAVNFTEFLGDILTMSQPANIVKILTEIFMTYSVHSGKTKSFKKILDDNIHLLKPQLAIAYIFGDRQRFVNLMFHMQVEIRRFYGYYSFVLIRKCLQPQFMAMHGFVTDFINFLLSLMYTQACKKSLSSRQYFRLISDLVDICPQNDSINRLFLEKDMVALMADFMLEKSSPVQLAPKSTVSASKRSSSQIAPIIKIIESYVVQSTGFADESLLSLDDQRMRLSTNAILCLSCPDFYEMALTKGEIDGQSCSSSLAAIIGYLSRDNEAFSEAIIRQLLLQINKITDSYLNLPILQECCKAILTLNDSLVQYRLEAMLGFATPYVRNDNTFTNLNAWRFIYQSSLNDLYPVECLVSYLYLYNDKQIYVCQSLAKLIEHCALAGHQQLKYLMELEPPTYQFVRFVDWMNLQYMKKEVWEEMKYKYSQILGSQSLAQDSIYQIVNHPVLTMTGKTLPEEEQVILHQTTDDVVITVTSVPCWTCPYNVGLFETERLMQKYKKMEKELEEQRIRDANNKKRDENLAASQQELLSSPVKNPQLIDQYSPPQVNQQFPQSIPDSFVPTSLATSDTSPQYIHPFEAHINKQSYTLSYMADPNSLILKMMSQITKKTEIVDKQYRLTAQQVASKLQDVVKMREEKQAAKASQFSDTETKVLTDLFDEDYRPKKTMEEEDQSDMVTHAGDKHTVGTSMTKDQCEDDSNFVLVKLNTDAMPKSAIPMPPSEGTCSASTSLQSVVAPVLSSEPPPNIDAPPIVKLSNFLYRIQVTRKSVQSVQTGALKSIQSGSNTVVVDLIDYLPKNIGLSMSSKLCVGITKGTQSMWMVKKMLGLPNGGLQNGNTMEGEICQMVQTQSRKYTKSESTYYNGTLRWYKLGKPISPQKIEQQQVSNSEMTPQPQSDQIVESQPSAMDQMDDNMRSCPFCTSFNPIDAAMCSVCENDINLMGVEGGMNLE